MRLGNWKGVRLQTQKNPDGPSELYDLETDPSETKNIAATNPEIVQRLREIMKRENTPPEAAV